MSFEMISFHSVSHEILSLDIENTSRTHSLHEIQNKPIQHRTAGDTFVGIPVLLQTIFGPHPDQFRPRMRRKLSRPVYFVFLISTLGIAYIENTFPA